MDKVARVQGVFDAWAADGQADRMADSHWPVARVALERLALAPTDRFLDIGCGNGYAVRWAAARLTQGHAIGIDVAPQMIALARKLSGALPNVEFHAARFGMADGLGEGRFDAIFSMEVFYYLPDLGAGLARALTLLKPGGRFACAVDFYGENVASHSWPDDVGVPMTLLSEAEWRAAFARAGFDTVRQERIRQEADPSSWKATEGTLLTLGTRA